MGQFSCIAYLDFFGFWTFWLLQWIMQRAISFNYYLAIVCKISKRLRNQISDKKPWIKWTLKYKLVWNAILNFGDKSKQRLKNSEKINFKNGLKKMKCTLKHLQKWFGLQRFNLMEPKKSSKIFVQFRIMQQNQIRINSHIARAGWLRRRKSAFHQNFQIDPSSIPTYEGSIIACGLFLGVSKYIFGI